MNDKLIENINPEKKYRIDEVASETILNCSRSMIYKLIFLGELEYLLIGNHYRIPGWSIIKYMENNHG